MTSSRAIAVTLLLILPLQGCDVILGPPSDAPLDQTRAVSRAQMHQPPALRGVPPVAPN